MIAVLFKRRLSLLLAAAALVAWGGFGLWQGLHTGFSGGLYDPGYRVPGVRPASPAATAGFQPGDRIVSVAGKPVEQLGMESRWPRSLAPQPGQSHRFVVERGGQRVDIDFVYPAPSRAAVDNRIRSALIGLGFLLFGLWGFFTAGTPAALALLHTGLCAGVSMATGLGPNLGSWNGLQGHLSTAAAALLFLLLLRFFLLFPEPKPLAASRLLWGSLYGLWAAFLAFLAAELITHPALYYTTGSVAYPLMLLYCLLILAAIVHTLARSPRPVLRRSGLLWLLGAILIALAGALSNRFPGWTSALPVLLIPFALALAVRNQARAA